MTMIPNIVEGIWKAITGRLTADEIDGFKKAVCDALIFSLNGFAIPYDGLSFWTNDKKYQKALEETRVYLLEQLYTQGGLPQYIATQIGVDDITVNLGTPPEGTDATRLISQNLPSDCCIWYSLYFADNEPARLKLEWDGGEFELDPANSAGYTVGRETDSGDMSTMITIPDENNIISRRQAAIFFEHGKWYCTPISENCRTSFLQNTGDHAKPGKKGILVDSKRRQNRIEFSNDRMNIVLRCHLISNNL